jgi:hypothetical protein
MRHIRKAGSNTGRKRRHKNPAKEPKKQNTRERSGVPVQVQKLEGPHMFKPEVNIGHILILVGLIASGVTAYGAAMSQFNAQSLRIEIVEKAIDKQAKHADEQSQSLNNISRDLAVIRFRVESVMQKP